MRKRLDVIDVNPRTNMNVRQNQTNVHSRAAREANVPAHEMSEEERRRRIRQRRARQLAIKRRKRERMLRLAGMAAAIVVLLVLAANLEKMFQTFFKPGSDSVNAEDERHDGAGKRWEQTDADTFLYEVAFEDFFKEYSPESLEESQVYRRLKDLAEEYPELKEIYNDCDKYPVRLLASLCNNPEMHEFVKGYLKYEAGDTSVVKTAELTEAEKGQRYPLFLQWDARWGYEEYGDFNIALSGCGPTALAMAAVAITGDDTITPDKVAEYSMENGFYVEGTGTAWSLMTEGAKDFELDAQEISLDESVMKRALDNGKVIICSMWPGDFTSVGHFIMIYGYDDNGFKVNDPNCIYRSSRYWTYNELSSQIRILWAYGEV